MITQKQTAIQVGIVLDRDDRSVLTWLNLAQRSEVVY